MKNPASNFAFIDSQNLNLGIKSLGWDLDFKKFRVYLRDKFCVDKAFLFIGYLPGNQPLYTHLQSVGYILVFKPTLVLKNGTVKGNVDAELVLHAMIELPNYEKAVLVTGDGDFHCLAEHLLSIGKLEKILVPNPARYSVLLRSLGSKNRNIINFLSYLSQKLAK